VFRVGVRNGEVVITVETEMDWRALRAMLEPRWSPIMVRGEDMSEAMDDLHDKLSEIEWE